MERSVSKLRPCIKTSPAPKCRLSYRLRSLVLSLGWAFLHTTSVHCLVCLFIQVDYCLFISGVGIIVAYPALITRIMGFIINATFIGCVRSAYLPGFFLSHLVKQPPVNPILLSFDTPLK